MAYLRNKGTGNNPGVWPYNTLVSEPVDAQAKIPFVAPTKKVTAKPIPKFDASMLKPKGGGLDANSSDTTPAQVPINFDLLKATGTKTVPEAVKVADYQRAKTAWKNLKAESQANEIMAATNEPEEIADAATRTLNAIKTVGGSAIGDPINAISPDAAAVVSKYTGGWAAPTTEAELRMNRSGNPNRWENRLGMAGDAVTSALTAEMGGAALGKITNKFAPITKTLYTESAIPKIKAFHGKTYTEPMGKLNDIIAEKSSPTLTAFTDILEKPLVPKKFMLNNSLNTTLVDDVLQTVTLNNLINASSKAGSAGMIGKGVGQLYDIANAKPNYYQKTILNTDYQKELDTNPATARQYIDNPVPFEDKGLNKYAESAVNIIGGTLPFFNPLMKNFYKPFMVGHKADLPGAIGSKLIRKQVGSQAKSHLLGNIGQVVDLGATKKVSKYINRKQQEENIVQ